MLKSYKFRLYLNKTQKHLFEKTFGCCRFVYNYCLNKKIESYKKDKTQLSAFTLIKELTQLKKDSKYWWLKEVSIIFLQQSILDTENAFKRFFKTKRGFPKFKSKHNSKHFFRFYYPKIDFDNSRIKIPKTSWVKIRGIRTFDGKVTKATVSKTKTNKYYISILVEDGKEIPLKPQILPNTTIGIDLGLKTFATISDGRKIKNPKYLKQYGKRLSVLQRRASKKQKGSNNKKKANFKVAKCYEKISSCRLDFLHKLSYNLTHENQVSTIVVENLSTKEMMQNGRLAKSISDASWSMFIRMLEYKCDWYGKNLIKVDPTNTSKTCSNCGWISKDLKLSNRKWTCEICKKQLDRDLNASINIKNSGLEKSVEPVEMSSSNIESTKQEACT